MRVDVLGVEVSVVRMNEVCTAVDEWIAQGEGQYVCVTGVHGVMESQGDPELLQIHNRSGLAVPDGMPMVWSGRLAGARSISRVYGPDMMLAVCELAARRGWKSFLYGGGPGVADRLAERLRARYPGLEIVGSYCPPFRDLSADEDAEVVDLIDASEAELVWVGLSTPKQERWMAAHVQRLAAPCVLFGVGAAFDINAGLRSDAPQWMRPLGLHWLHRLIKEPRRLWRRYLVNNPRFVWSLIRRPPRLIVDETSD